MSGRDQFITSIPVPHGTLAKLDRFAELLLTWNRKFNLISKSTEPEIWSRHFLDSAQLFSYIPKDTKTIADLGSGAGFPGLVLSIMGAPEIHLIESTGKKARFLLEVIEELKLKAKVHYERVEDIRGFSPDIMTSRACASIADLFSLTNQLRRKDSFYLLLKGKKAQDELTESAKYWKFRHRKHKSLSDPSGCVLILKDVEFKHAAPRDRSARHKSFERR